MHTTSEMLCEFIFLMRKSSTSIVAPGMFGENPGKIWKKFSGKLKDEDFRGKLSFSLQDIFSTNMLFSTSSWASSSFKLRKLWRQQGHPL